MDHGATLEHKKYSSYFRSHSLTLILRLPKVIVALGCIIYLILNIDSFQNLISLFGILAYILICVFLSKYPAKVNLYSLVVSSCLHRIYFVFLKFHDLKDKLAHSGLRTAHTIHLRRFSHANRVRLQVVQVFEQQNSDFLGIHERRLRACIRKKLRGAFLCIWSELSKFILKFFSYQHIKQQNTCSFFVIKIGDTCYFLFWLNDKLGLLPRCSAVFYS